MSKKVFVPLTTKFFYQFKNEGKRFELRRLGGPWNTNNIYSSRPVVLSKGYGKYERIKGIIGAVHVGSLNQIFKIIPYRLIIADAKSKREAIESVELLLGNSAQFIAFEFIPNKKTGG